jgi:hypothetical protein
MKTDLLDLKAAYRDFLDGNKPASRESCPSPEDLVLLVRSRISRRRKTKIMDHAAKCAYCLQELKTILDVTSQENKFILAMNDALNSAAHEQSPRTNPLARRVSWNYVSVAAIVILLAGIAAYSIFRFSSKPDFLRGPVAGIHLVSPADKVVPGAELKFVWEGLPNAKFYIIEAFDASLDLVWRSESMTANEFSPPHEILQKFRPDETYFWTVTAILEGGSKIKSNMNEFSIKK